MRIAHISDLHFGRHDPLVTAGLAAELAAQAPDLIVISGDFAQIGSKREFAAARDFVATLSAPVFAVPGNHDVPARGLIARFLDPYGRYRRYIAQEIEPFLEMDGVALAGVNTARRLRLGLNWADGAINRRQLAGVAARFATASPDAVRVVVAHHPLLLPDEPVDMRPVKRAKAALAAFAALDVRLVLSGHFHRAYVRSHGGEGAAVGTAAERPQAAGPMLLAQAATTLSTRLRGESNGYNLIDIVDGAVTVRARQWVGQVWADQARARTPG